MYRMIGFLAFLAASLHLLSGFAVAEEYYPEGFFDGDYVIIGRHPDNGGLYQGKLQIKRDGKSWTIRRSIDGKSTDGVGKISPIAGGDARAFTMIFARGGHEYEATFSIDTDPDNYPRLTGYVYLADGSTTEVGLEAAFADIGQLKKSPD